MSSVRSINEPRLLLEVELAPLLGSRFQPTGFPDLGAAEYTAGDRRMLLVESAQSMANRLEASCWDEAAGDLVAPLDGLPYVEVELPDGAKTNSILEAHRLNSVYIEKSDGWHEITEAVGFTEKQPFDRRRLAVALMRLDPNSLIHGIFLESIAGVVRLPRMLSAFIEASDVSIAPSGGVKFDRVQPATGAETTPYGRAAEGYGNVPFHRDEYAAAKIDAYFNLDLALLRGLGLSEAAEELLFDLALFKIRRFLAGGLRLRTACDLEVVAINVLRPVGWELPPLDELEERLPQRIEAAAGDYFSEPRKRTYRYEASKKG